MLILSRKLDQVLRRTQLYTTAEVEPITVGASMDTTFKLDTALNLDCDQIFEIIWVSYTKQMSRSYKLKIKKLKTTTTPLFLQLVQSLIFPYT